MGLLRGMKKDRLVEIASDIDALYVDKDDTEVKFAAVYGIVSTETLDSAVLSTRSLL